jgi:hypothetical protein
MRRTHRDELLQPHLTSFEYLGRVAAVTCELGFQFAQDPTGHELLRTCVSPCEHVLSTINLHVVRAEPVA